MINNFVKINPQNATSFVSVGQKELSINNEKVDLVIGNSSSGIIEAPFLKYPLLIWETGKKGEFRDKQ